MGRNCGVFPKNTTNLLTISDHYLVDSVSQFGKHDPKLLLNPLDALTQPFFTDLFDCQQVDGYNGNSKDDNVVDVINVNSVPENLVDFTYEEVNFMSAQTKHYFNIM
ncbi:glycogen synthase kinase [Theileria orientalis]|uniref:Glycogen synthase kinase n=1 Tax=Theileria orientalis TaxID=68886 RepID=A0A976XK10_THEOR|nr:glycogen synthase kinase [Theileria orientalis]